MHFKQYVLYVSKPLLLFFLLVLTFSVSLASQSGDIHIRKISWRDTELPVSPRSHYVYRVSFELDHVSLDRLEVLLKSEGFLEKVPYYSRYNDTTTLLYNRVEFQNDTINVEMRPFEPFKGQIQFNRKGDSIHWVYENTESIRYKWFPVIAQRHMVTYLNARQDADTLKVEGLAAIKTFPFLHLFGKRIDWAVEGRILALFQALSKQ